MKKMVRKFLLATAAVFALTVIPAAAATEGDDEMVEEPSNKDKMKEGSKEFFSGLGGTFKDAGHTIKSKAKSVTAPAYIGDWQFVNGKSTSYLYISEDETMSFVQEKGNSRKMWKGTYTVSKKQIVFHVESDGSKAMDEDWVITYKASKNKSLQVTCKKLPKDANGYSFANSTLFTPVDDDEE